MERRESDREDLLREATALVERIELRIPAEPEQMVVGFRRDGSASFFFGAQSAYQFNSSGEFRRGYIGGLLYKAERGQLVSLRRQRSDAEVALIRTELNTDEAERLLADVQRRLLILQQAFLSDSITVIGQIPPDAGLISRITGWLSQMASPLRIAPSPHAR
jgi:hypothetical protein